MKIEKVRASHITAHRTAEVSDGPILGDRRKFRVSLMMVTYYWSAKERTWSVQHIELSGPTIRKDGSEGFSTVAKVIWLADAGEPYTGFRRIAANLAPVGDPLLPGVLDA